MRDKEYIERGALVSILYAKSEMAMGTPKAVFASVSKMVELLPAADVVEVRYGEWVEHFGFDCWHYDCPFCDDGYATQQRDETPPNYCSNCGARLTLERKEQT